MDRLRKRVCQFTTLIMRRRRKRKKRKKRCLRLEKLERSPKRK
jgi:hypothetical protein